MAGRPGGRVLRLLTETELQRIERGHPDGVTTGEIIGIFETAGSPLSEATFRKYVQVGLLPRCRRVGQKGKHKGSQGIYPVRTVRLINEIKRLNAGERTLEELAATVFALVGPIDTFEDALADLLDALRRAAARVADTAERKVLERTMKQLQADGEDYLRKVHAVREQVKGATEAEEETAAERRRTA